MGRDGLRGWVPGPGKGRTSPEAIGSQQRALCSDYMQGQDCVEKDDSGGTSLAVQWLGLHASTAGGTGLIPGQGTKIPQAVQRGQKIKK